MEFDKGYTYSDFDESCFEKQIPEANVTDFSTSYEIVYMDSSTEVLLKPISVEECSHNKEKVNVAEHTKNSDGSCVVLMNEGLYCKECENIVLGGIIYTSSMAECVH